ncbi:MAG: hypothetical protein LBC63_10470 [Holophagales bacterium]|jgi:hypothetical protein|nr:hypothetical protein [Holophagales bacterium]
MPDKNGKVDYRAAIKEAVGSPNDDKWAERTLPNTGTQLAPGMLRVSEEFASEYAENLNARYSKQPR